ncbi:MAG: tRNA (N6-isopentenyl adenosine(37)-C2)-methylthiotransferase MiaB [Alphaproteobacteria bacterium]|uniref:tRNA-2-methylthio-N(6)-dimethylallyladenosine synthase n=1 Tax=Candidatus Nitrobium versatile TaxID=2884831 RepID=A0A953M2D8_9BACT|nr:tRNA (N6-isopentenyl adenosine(37)-C2)-methylthiotransferase MiaB [Candidatus Nitrobium versatile]
MKKYYVHTMGCQMNVHDSEKMSGILKAEGYIQADTPRDADLIIFNTCSIRQKAEQKFFSELGRLKSLKKKRPGIKIAVAGCIAQQEGSKIFQRAPHVDFVLGPQNIHKVREIAQAENDFVAVEDNPFLTDMEFPVEREDSIRAWVNIMYGCNNFCSYCIVPYTRGREKSRASHDIVNEVKGLAERGYKEVTLLGQNVNSYRSSTDFPGLLRQINAVEGLERIRFVTSHPKDLSDDLIHAIRDLEKVCEHMHLPLQSGSTEILGKMNRKYTYDEYLQRVEKLKKEIPGIAITTDIIAGFPRETEEDHLCTVRALREIQYDGIFAFKYSPRVGTRAASMEGHLDAVVKSERLSEILELQNKITDMKNRALKGTVQEVLVEGQSEKDEGRLTGRTRSNKIVTFPDTPDSKPGSVVSLEITKANRHSLEGIILF